VVSELGVDGTGRDSLDDTVHGSSCACRRSGFVESTASVTSLLASLIISAAAARCGRGARPGGRGAAAAHGAPGRNDEYGRQFLDCLIEPGERGGGRPATRSVGVIAPRRPGGADGGRQFQGRLLSPRGRLVVPIIDALSNT